MTLLSEQHILEKETKQQLDYSHSNLTSFQAA